MDESERVSDATSADVITFVFWPPVPAPALRRAVALPVKPLPGACSTSDFRSFVLLNYSIRTPLTSHIAAS